MNSATWPGQVARLKLGEAVAAYETELPRLDRYRIGWPPDLTQEYGVDHYGIDALRTTILQHPRARDLLIVMFLDALMNTAIHQLGHALRSLHPRRPICVLNSDNVLTTPYFNFTHRTPQALLALKSDWSDDDVSALREIALAYFLDCFDQAFPVPSRQIVSAFYRSLAEDPDLGHLKFPLDLSLADPAIPRAYRDALVEASNLLGTR